MERSDEKFTAVKFTDDGLTKVQRYRREQVLRGKKQLRIWTPDPHRPEFLAEAARQGALLRGAPEELEALGFCEALADWPQE